MSIEVPPPAGRILIIGQGVAGQALARGIAAQKGTVVGFLDDVATGGKVLGRLADVNEVVVAEQIDLIYFAIPSARAGLVRSFISSVESADVDFAMVPRTYATITKDTVAISDLSDVDVLDLVGREPVKHDLIESKEFISGKRVLVTGAAGSIGSRLVAQLSSMEPDILVCVDWSENGIFHLSQEIGDVEHVRYRIADVKNEALVERIFSEFRPELVFHAAAYKHVPLMQDNPIEAVNNNVWGTLNLMQLAVKHHVGGVILVSTDKAVNPVNVMGVTKRLGEMMMESLAAQTTETRFTAVRFGNVIESNGSVVQTFRNQIAKKKPLTVTHPDITRFFMTIDEASQLIIQSALLGQNNEIFVLDMGEPVKILDLAKSLVRAVDPSLEIVITGLRPGEKMYEELSYEPDRVDRTRNEKIFIVKDEEDFSHDEFMASVASLLAETRQYSISPQTTIDRLREFGFTINQ